eukprot:Skav209056  [mRNA]  locus=scaffold760:119053:122888:+ [translate_table: standard]
MAEVTEWNAVSQSKEACRSLRISISAISPSGGSKSTGAELGDTGDPCASSECPPRYLHFGAISKSPAPLRFNKSQIK